MKARSVWPIGAAALVVVLALLLPATILAATAEEAYAPYVAGPVIHESDLYAPYTDAGEPYAPYVAGPVIHPRDLYAP